jgi:hypothetical protein
MTQEDQQVTSQAWSDGYADAMAGKRIDVPRNRPAWTGAQRQLYLDGYMTGLAYFLGILHGEEGREPMTWPQVKADALWIGRQFRFDVEPGGTRYQSAYLQGRTAGSQARERKAGR